MRRAPRRTVASVITAAAALGLLALPASSAAQPVPAAAAPPCRTGAIGPTPSPGPYSSLFGISALSPQNVWAVGYYIRGGESVSQALIEHWTGRRWAVVRSPHAAPDAVLYEVTAVSPSDVWAVGLRANSRRLDQAPLAERWNGTAWSLVASPSVPGFLGALAVASPDDIWAAGIRQVAGGTSPARTLIERWNGTSWRLVPSPNPSKYGDILGGITVAGPDDVWAMGQAGTNSHDTAPLAEHWDGHAWSAVPVPAEGFSSNLGAVASAGADDVWSVGSYDVQTSTGTLSFTLTERWNGHRWSIVASPSPTGDDDLDGVAAVSPDDIWAVGSTANPATFVLRWDGHAWATLPARSRPGSVNGLFDVSAPAATDVWAAGGGYKTVAEHFCPSAGSRAGGHRAG
jgi:hypothetical protein